VLNRALVGTLTSRVYAKEVAGVVYFCLSGRTA